LSEERALIARAARGDEEAVDALVMTHRPTVVRVARHLLGDATGAEDIAQEVFVRLQASLPGFRGDAALSTWLYRVTLNLCRDHQRRSKRRRDGVALEAITEPGGGAPATAIASITEAPAAEQNIDRRRLLQTLRAAVDRLPENQREAVLLRFMEELSYKEIARLTGTPQGTVASRVFRALERLGRDLGSLQLEVVK
jgi:RNA polymerase sigma-70 factor (ECF subfamily)